MGKSVCVAASLGAAVFASLSSAQTSNKIDFARDVQPILKQNCVACHGPAQQNAGLRLDRRSSALKAGTRRIVPGSSANSFIYHRLIGGDYGPPMPPTGALRPEQIATIKTWIDQGAEWPDSLANEAERPPLNPKAVSMIESLRNDDLKSFLKQAAADPKLLDARGPDGATPFMYAVLYTNASTVAALLKQGADPNKHSDSNATALLWAATDLEKTRLLVDHGADVNVRSDELRTPLMVAARKVGGAPIVKLLLDHGAKLDPNAHPDAESSPLVEAATAADAESIDLLLKRGASVKAGGQPALAMSIALGCAKCLDLLAAKITDKAAYTGALQEASIVADPKTLKLLLDKGADVNAYDPLGRTPLMYAAGSDLILLDSVKLLVESGADINAKDKHKQSGDSGLTVLDIARFRGDTPVVQYLVQKGAQSSEPAAAPVLKVRLDNNVKQAIGDSLPLLQRADANFVPKAACASCHNNSITAMAVSFARKRQVRVDDTIAAQQVKANVFGLEKMRERFQQSFMFPTEDVFGPFIVGYMLVGLAGENYPADLNTDAAVMYLKGHQMPDGQWAYPIADTRPPICSVYIGQTALALRSLQLYAPKGQRVAYEKSVQLAASWIANAQPRNSDDLGWKVLGLAWADREQAAKKKAMQDLLALQRADGGWSDVPSMSSSAYATGKALYALHVAGLPATDPAYQRGVRYLLSTQQQDGSWFVKTRALGFQPFFDAGFPHGHDQWISTAGTAWATLALAATLPEARPATASRRP